MRVPDAAVAVLHSDADGVVEVGQVIGQNVRHLLLVVEALDGARGALVVLKAAHRSWRWRMEWLQIYFLPTRGASCSYIL